MLKNLSKSCIQFIEIPERRFSREERLKNKKNGTY